MKMMNYEKLKKHKKWIFFKNIKCIKRIRNNDNRVLLHFSYNCIVFNP